MGNSITTRRRAAGTQPLSQMQLGLMFYVGWPVLLGIILGWTGAGTLGGQLPKPIGVAYWVVGILLMRVSLELSIRLVAWLAPKGRTPLVALCLLSIPVQVYIGAPLTHVWQASFVDFLPESSRPELGGIFITSFERYFSGLLNSIVIALEWVILNLVFDRILGFARFRNVTGYKVPVRFPGPTDETDRLSAANLNFVKKIPERLGTDVLALSAEDHYVRVHTPLGSDLILYRFSDAMAEMPKDMGFQVHRSHWVRKSAISDFLKRGKGQVLILNGTIEVPVSKRFLELLKANGLQPSDQ